MGRRARIGLPLLAGILAFVPIAAIWLFLQFERACGATTAGVGRYCSVTQTWDWLRFEGGWWKMLLFAAVAAFAVWGQGKEAEAASKENLDAKDSDLPG